MITRLVDRRRGLFQVGRNCVVFAYTLCRREDTLNPVSERDVCGNECAPASDVTRPEALCRACGSEALSETSSHRSNQLLLEILGGAALERSVRRSDDRLGLAIGQARVSSAFPCAVESHQGFEEVAIR
jgi:hypothetical protein